MMIHITAEEVQMNAEVDKWRYLGEDGKLHVREDAPPEIHKHVEKIKKRYNALDFEKAYKK